MEVDVPISFGGALERPGVETVARNVEPLVPMCSSDLLASAGSVEALTHEATLVDSPLSRVTWRDWFAANGLPMTERPRHSFDCAAI